MIKLEELKEAGQIKTSELSNDDYHNGIGLSSSNVKAIINDIDKYNYELENPPPKSDALKFGTMFDELIFDLKLFKEKYFISSESSKAKKQFKDDVKNNPDKIVISASEYSLITGMETALFKNKTSKEILENGEQGLSFLTYESFTQRVLKVRPDNLLNGFIWDLKTCADIDDYSIKRAINNFGYDTSLGMYANVISEFQEVTGAGWIFISKKRPHQVRILAMSESDFIESQVKAENKVLQAEEMLKSKATTYQQGIEIFKWSWNS